MKKKVTIIFLTALLILPGQAIAVSQLGECHAQKLIRTCKRANPVVALVSGNTSAELTLW